MRAEVSAEVSVAVLKRQCAAAVARHRLAQAIAELQGIPAREWPMLTDVERRMFLDAADVLTKKTDEARMQ